ncbi:MAG: DUF1492 domain-containing protein [Clostridia bacterium]|nr:DUF1492 domain-containing protein [Clostridia bacterium]
MVDAKSFLREVELLDIKIRNKLIEREQWKDIAFGITASIGGERVQSSGSQQKMADAIVKCVDMETEIDRLIDELIDSKKKVIETIEKLYSPTEYKILHLRYIQYISLTDIADMLGKEYTWVTTTHGRALKSVQNILDKQ